MDRARQRLLDLPVQAPDRGLRSAHHHRDDRQRLSHAGGRRRGPARPPAHDRSLQQLRAHARRQAEAGPVRRGAHGAGRALASRRRPARRPLRPDVGHQHGRAGRRRHRRAPVRALRTSPDRGHQARPARELHPDARDRDARRRRPAERRGSAQGRDRRGRRRRGDRRASRGRRHLERDRRELGGRAVLAGRGAGGRDRGRPVRPHGGQPACRGEVRRHAVRGVGPRRRPRVDARRRRAGQGRRSRRRADRYQPPAVEPARGRLRAEAPQGHAREGLRQAAAERAVPARRP